MNTTISTREQLRNEKISFKEKMRKLKEEHEIKKMQIKHSEGLGYSSGSYDHDKIPKVKGAVKAAKKGYSKAMDDGEKLSKLKGKFYGGRLKPNDSQNKQQKRYR